MTPRALAIGIILGILLQATPAGTIPGSVSGRMVADDITNQMVDGGFGDEFGG